MTVPKATSAQELSSQYWELSSMSVVYFITLPKATNRLVASGVRMSIGCRAGAQLVARLLHADQRLSV